MKAKFCIVVIWKAGETEVYNNLKAFTDKFTAYSYDTINNSLSRKKEPFSDDKLTLTRKEIIC